MTPEAIAAALQSTPALRIEEARQQLVLTPQAHGFYALWIADPSLLGQIAPTLDPTTGMGLLYVGVGPGSARLTKRALPQRVADHTTGNTGTSTFRLGLAALLFEERRWSPYERRYGDKSKFLLPRAENVALSAWQREHLRVRWVEATAPWDHEPEVIRIMRPPLNRQHNEHHPEYTRVGVARDSYRDAARSAAQGPAH